MKLIRKYLITAILATLSASNLISSAFSAKAAPFQVYFNTLETIAGQDKQYKRRFKYPGNGARSEKPRNRRFFFGD